MDVEPTVATLEALFEETLQELAAVMAYCRFRVRVNNERVRDLDPSRHLLLDPEWPSGAD